jgi:hypothetical protein
MSDTKLPDGIAVKMGYLTTACANCGEAIAWTKREGLDTAPRWLHVDGESFAALTMYVRCTASDPRTAAVPATLAPTGYIYDHYQDPEVPIDATEKDQGSAMPVQPPNKPVFGVVSVDDGGEAEPYEEIDRPEYYRIEIDGHAFDVLDLIDATGTGFHIGNALKYLVRAGNKPGVNAVTDLRKAAYYVTRLADKLEAEAADEPF